MRAFGREDAGKRLAYVVGTGACALLTGHVIRLCGHGGWIVALALSYGVLGVLYGSTR